MLDAPKNPEARQKPQKCNASACRGTEENQEVERSSDGRYVMGASVSLDRSLGMRDKAARKGAPLRSD